ncbi:MAG: FIST N-terminal domain-containing protein [Pseudomonadota bacterium]|nr:FIST N-terminal domain-containing protein [Pseudomonadota bacterium]
MDTATDTFRLGHASDADWETLTASCLDQIGTIPTGANLGFLYVTDTMDEDFPLIAERLRQKSGVDHWVGTIGFGVMVGGREYFDTPAMVAMIGVLDEDDFRVMPTIDTPGDPLPADIMDWVARKTPFLGVVHADPRNAYVGDILDSITDDTEAFLVGGLTASRGKQAQIADEPTEGGVSGVLFSGDVGLTTGLSQGCSPVGEIHDVTRSKDNILFELDGRPALDVFKEDIGEILARKLERVGGYIHVALPVSGDDSGDYLVRNVVGIDPNNKLFAIGERVSRGDRIMFVRRDGPSALEDLERMLADVTSRSSGVTKAALYYSCVARGPNLFGPDSRELKVVQDALGKDVPLVGFFANGEISKNRLYGYTGVLTLIG